VINVKPNNMTPQEKAEELVLKFEDYTDCADERGFAIKCALIAVDEIINILNSDINPLANYWYEVKTEIEKL
jgi:hypothetical protein